MGKGVGYKIYSRKCNPRDYKMDKHEERVHLRFLRLEAFLKGFFFFSIFHNHLFCYHGPHCA